MAKQQQFDNRQLLARLAASDNPCEQIGLLELLWQHSGGAGETGLGGSVCELTEMLYEHACRARLWSVIRRAAGLLDKTDETLEDALADILAHQHRLAVGCAYDNEAVISQPMSTADLVQRIHRYSGGDMRSRVLIQEIILFLGMLIKVDPVLFRGTLTLRAWHLLLLLTGALAREQGIDQGKAFDTLLTLSPHSVLERLQQVLASDRTIRQDLIRLDLQTLQHRTRTFAMQQVRFAASDDPQLSGADDWAAWREVNGVLTRLPEDFYPRVWEILQHCHGLIIGHRLDRRNRLDSATLLADTTPAEKSFALHVDYLLNNIALAEYRQLCIEALLALSAIVRANPQLRVNSDAVLDVLIDTAVQLSWRELHRNLSDDDYAKAYNERCAEAWDSFYARPPHQVANAIMSALNMLIETHPAMLAAMLAAA
jgi:phosphorylase kinase alpha/beta subunit